MRQIKIITIDNDLHASSFFQKLANDYFNEIEIIRQYSNPCEFLEDFGQIIPDFDILFLDTEMDPINGIDLLKELHKKNQELLIDVIFLAAHEKYAMDAFRCDALDYILKPINITELQKCIAKFKLRKKKLEYYKENISSKLPFKKPEAYHDRIAISTFNAYEFINLQHIIRCEAERNYCKIVCGKSPGNFGKETYLVSKNLKNIAFILENKGFLRVHHSHLINPNFIVKIQKSNGGIIEMVDGAKIRITGNKKHIMELLFDQIQRV